MGICFYVVDRTARRVLDVDRCWLRTPTGPLTPAIVRQQWETLGLEDPESRDQWQRWCGADRILGWMSTTPGPYELISEYDEDEDGFLSWAWFDFDGYRSSVAEGWTVDHVHEQKPTC